MILISFNNNLIVRKLILFLIEFINNQRNYEKFKMNGKDEKLSILNQSVAFQCWFLIWWHDLIRFLMHGTPNPVLGLVPQTLRNILMKFHGDPFHRRLVLLQSRFTAKVDFFAKYNRSVFISKNLIWFRRVLEIILCINIFKSYP